MAALSSGIRGLSTARHAYSSTPPVTRVTALRTAEPVMLTSVASVPFLQAAGTYVKGYEPLHGYKIRFGTT